MTQKFHPNHLAVGTWDPQPWRRVRAEQSAAKIRVWLQDKLVTLGKPVDLWLPVNESTSGVVACTCVKNTTATADRNCLSCHGTKYAPGYLKFGYSTLFWASAEVDDLTLADTALVTTKKVNVVQLDAAALTGTITTHAKAYTNPQSADWELRLDAFNRAAGSSIELEYSTDAGDTWTAVSLTAPATGRYGYTGTLLGTDLGTSGSILFRVTLTRAAVSDLSPAFEILRLRRPKPETVNPIIMRKRDDYEAGKVLILRTQVMEQNMLDPGRGRITDHAGDRSWTSPLDFFDTSMTPETRAVRVVDEKGPHPFYLYSEGVQEATRYPIVKVSFNQQFSPHFTHQFFDDRRAADNEPYADVW